MSFGKRPLVVDNAGTDGVQCLVTAVANRYTVARGVAQRAVDLAYRKLGREAAPVPDRDGPGVTAAISAGSRTCCARCARRSPSGTDPLTVDRLAHDHGSAYGEVTRVIDERPEWGRPVAGTDMLRAEVVHSARNEMVARAGRRGLRPARDRHAR